MNGIKMNLAEQLLSGEFCINQRKTRKKNESTIITGYKERLVKISYNTSKKKLLECKEVGLYALDFEQNSETDSLVRPITIDQSSIVQTVHEWLNDRREQLNRISEHKNLAVEISNKYTRFYVMAGTYTQWLVFTVPESSSDIQEWDGEEIKVRLSVKQDGNWSLYNKPQLPAFVLSNELFSAIRNIEEKSWSILSSLQSGEKCWKIFSGNNPIVWKDGFPWYVKYQSDTAVTIVNECIDWSGAARGFAPNPWPDSVLDSVCNSLYAGTVDEYLSQIPNGLLDSLNEQIKA
jgi:hypothetical protein